MRDLFPEDWKPNLKKLMLGFDAWVDSTVFRSGSGLRELYERYSTFMDRFHVVGLPPRAGRVRLGRRNVRRPPARC